MFRFLQVLFNPEIRRAARTARAFFAARHPELEVIDIRFTTKDANRITFAFLYRTRMHQRPAPYKVLSVSKDNSEVAEIDLATHPEYRLRDYK